MSSPPSDGILLMSPPPPPKFPTNSTNSPLTKKSSPSVRPALITRDSPAPPKIPHEPHNLASPKKVVAIGETGLDYSPPPSPPGQPETKNQTYKTRQRALFEQQLKPASDLKLNVIIHQREAFEDTLQLL